MSIRLEPANQKASIFLKINLADKQKATELFDKLGLDLSTAINLSIQQSPAEGGLPFEVKDSFYSDANQAELNRRFKEVQQRPNFKVHHLLESDN